MDFDTLTWILTGVFGLAVIAVIVALLARAGRKDDDDRRPEG